MKKKNVELAFSTDPRFAELLREIHAIDKRLAAAEHKPKVIRFTVICGQRRVFRTLEECEKWRAWGAIIHEEIISE